MRISYNWIRELVPDMTLLPLELAELLTRHSFETNVVGEYGVPAGVKTVRITKITKHPNADKLQLATITAGRNEITLVCGARNIKVGQIVPYSPPGVELKNEEGKKFVVEAKDIRGEMSEGMLNSLRELGLHHDHAGIWVLAEDTPLGQELADLISPDTILEAEISPNRAHDCLSHLGVAREVAALLRVPVAEPLSLELPKPKEQVEGWTIKIADSRLCPRYMAVVVDNLRVAPSPLWLQARLLAAGGKPINNLVDATNYVTFEYGNPTHIFDRTTLPGKTIGVREGSSGETLTTLDEMKRDLTPDDIVITAEDKPVALAGIMGGGEGATNENTTQGLLEVANFNAFRIQETSRRLNLRTEASARFSKGLDPNVAALAAARMISVLRETTEEKVLGVIDSYPEPVSPRKVSFNPARVGEVAGSDIFNDKDTKNILTHLRCKVSDKKSPWGVTVPTDRLDIEGEHDLVEEVIRVTGLDKIISNPPQKPTHHNLPPSVYWREVVRDTLVELGLTETYNYSFVKEGELALINPPAPEKKYLRTHLMPGLLANLDKNRAEFQRAGGGSLFEIGRIYKPAPPSSAKAKAGSGVPGVIEEIHLAAAIVGGFPTLEHVSQKITEALSITPQPVENVIAPAKVQALKYHLPVTGFEINLGELLLGVEKDVPLTRTLEDIQAAGAVPSTFVPLPKYPSVFRDISMLVDSNIALERAQEVIERAGGELVADVDLFDEFMPSTFAKASADAAEPRKSLAFHVEYRAADHTLSDAEVNPIHAKIIAALEAELSAQIR